MWMILVTSSLSTLGTTCNTGCVSKPQSSAGKIIEKIPPSFPFDSIDCHAPRFVLFFVYSKCSLVFYWDSWHVSPWYSACSSNLPSICDRQCIFLRFAPSVLLFILESLPHTFFYHTKPEKCHETEKLKLKASLSSTRTPFVWKEEKKGSLLYLNLCPLVSPNEWQSNDFESFSFESVL